jgi:hypothetical protein
MKEYIKNIVDKVGNTITAISFALKLVFKVSKTLFVIRVLITFILYNLKPKVSDKM